MASPHDYRSAAAHCGERCPAACAPLPLPPAGALLPPPSCSHSLAIPTPPHHPPPSQSGVAEEEAAAAFLLCCAPAHVPAVLALRPPAGEELHPRLARLQAHLLLLPLRAVPQQLLQQLGSAAGGGRSQRLAGTGPVLLAQMLRVEEAGGQQEQREPQAAEAAAAQQQGSDAQRTPEQSMWRRLFFYYLRILSRLCLVPPSQFERHGLRVPPRREVLCGRSLAWWACIELPRQAQATLGQPNWVQHVLDHVLCMALAALPQQLPQVMSMLNLRVDTW